MSSKIRIFKHGLHFGEERVIVGNDRSGMVYFSGCHLACKDCYTPETSRHWLGSVYSPEEFLSLLRNLRDRGARNINLVSPTHYWGQIKESLRLFKLESPEVPVVLKISGYETKETILSMAEVADVFVPDFKVLSPEAALTYHLPTDYGSVTLLALFSLHKSHAPLHDSYGNLKRGIVVRHLIAPNLFKETLQVSQALQDIRFTGYLNLMTNYFDTSSRTLKKAPALDLQKFYNSWSKNEFITLLIDGKEPLPHVRCGS